MTLHYSRRLTFILELINVIHSLRRAIPWKGPTFLSCLFSSHTRAASTQYFFYMINWCPAPVLVHSHSPPLPSLDLYNQRTDQPKAKTFPGEQWKERKKTIFSSRWNWKTKKTLTSIISAPFFFKTQILSETPGKPTSWPIAISLAINWGLSLPFYFYDLCIFIMFTVLMLIYWIFKVYFCQRMWTLYQGLYILSAQ